MQKNPSLFLAACLISMTLFATQVYAEGRLDKPLIEAHEVNRPIVEIDDDPSDGIHAKGISLKSVGAGILSFAIWPGIGQMVNTNNGDKVVTHAVLGLVPLYRFWSGYDALVDREGGYWKGRI